MTVTHLRVGQAWTAYVAAIGFSWLLAILGGGLIVGGLLGSVAADVPDPAATAPAAAPAAVATPARKAGHRTRSQAAPAAYTPTPAEQAEAAQARSHGMVMAGLLALALWSLVVAYRVAVVRSVRLSTNDDGVYIEHGIVPWARHGHGVKWRDLEGAAHFGGFMSWALKSHTVRISHRFTQSSEIVIGHVGRAGDVVNQINDIHRAMISGPRGGAGVDAAH